MPKLISPLHNTACRSLRYNDTVTKTNRLRDGGGLYLEALPTGRKVWRLEYKTLKGTKSRATLPNDFGVPGGSLADARKWRDDLRALLADGIDPNKKAKQDRIAAQTNSNNTFDALADDWLSHKQPDWSATNYKKVSGIVKRVLRPSLGPRPINEITPRDVLLALQKLETQNKLETAHRSRAYASAIFRRAILLEITDNDPATVLTGALRPNKSQNRAHITDPSEIGSLLRAIDHYDGQYTTGFALQLLPHLFTRPGELRLASWREFDLSEAVWSIPEGRMKSRRPHSVPLSIQVVAILKNLAIYTRHADHALLFPSIRTNVRSISDNTINAALRRIGFTPDQITAHGFRHTASTRLHEMGWQSHVIETQLAHKDTNKIRAVYNKAEYWEERVKMMQAWSNYLDELKNDNLKVLR